MFKSQYRDLRSVTRVLSIGLLIGLAAIQLGMTQYWVQFYPEGILLSSLLYCLVILLAGTGFDALGAFCASTLSIVLTTLIHLRSHTATPLWMMMLFGAIAIGLYVFLGLFEKEIVQKRIIYNDLDAQWNDLSEAYSKHKANVRSNKHKIMRLSTLRQLGEKLLSTLSLDEAAKKTLELSNRLVGKGDLLTLYLIDENLKSFTLTHLMCTTDKGNEITSNPSDVFNQWIMRSRQSLLVEDLQSDFRFEATIKGSSVASLIAAPLITENKLIGAIRIVSTSPKIFQVEDLRILTTLASVASSSLKNARLYNETLELSIKDGLTGLFVYTHFHHEFKKAFNHAKKSGNVLSVLMGDIDNFKMVNDKFGHTVGDTVLKKIAEIFHNEIDPIYVPTRYGGEEFAAFFPGWDVDKVYAFTDNILKKIAEIPFEIRRERLQITLSAGVCQIQNKDVDQEALLYRADQALYVAKRSGKNRVVKG